jgi:putative glutamine amidotransferase
VAGRKYAEAVRLAGCLPLVVPSIAPDEIDDLLDVADGVLLTGSPSNVHPLHFAEEVRDTALPLDPERDTWTLPLIPRVIERGIPLFAISRGFQETNVALGGSLHQAVHEVPGQRDHRGAADAPPEVTYGIAHAVDVMPGGLLEDILGQRTIEVNSVHGQGVNRLAPKLRVEARAPDGLVEAFSVPDARAFNLGVQWHPEWQAATNPVSMRLFKAFGQACQSYRDRHRAPEPEGVPDR